MKRVYFKRLLQFDNSTVSKTAGDLLQRIIDDEAIKLEDHVPIKVHFGEKGNETYIPAPCYDGIIKTLKDSGAKTSYIETNVLYRGERTTKTAHLKVAKEHGFTQIPIMIADGERGEDYYEVNIDKQYFDICKYGLGFKAFNQMVVCSHFKGHEMAGFGGAIKQLSMGFASRGGKMAQHAKLVPKVSEKKCISCGLCVTSCDVDAIEMKEKAEVIEHVCIGCAGCIAVCPVGAIRNDWEAENFKEKVAEYAYGAQRDKRFIYINFLMNITQNCDCVGQPMEKVSKDIGLLVSSDPVAIDMACFNILKQTHGHALFESGLTQIEHAKAIGFSDAMYTLIEL